MTALKPALYPAEKAAKPTKVLVTGSTGFLAGSIVRRLLEAGHTVHATARNPKNAASVAHLTALPGAAERLKLFKADLLEPGSFDEAAKGCEVVLHTASPYTITAGYGEAAQKNLVDPAVKGTENVIGTVERTPSVKRVVLTSSCASIYHSGSDKKPGEIFTEADWNTRSSLDTQPYSYSKTMAERRAWELVKGQTRWDLVVMNPPMIAGPPVGARADGESINLVARMWNGEMWPAAPVSGFGWTDVRTVAAAHCLAAFTPSAKGRYILSAGSAYLHEVVGMIAKAYPKEVSPPVFFVPKWLLLVIGPLVGMSRDMVRCAVGVTVLFDSSKAKKELGLDFIPLEETFKDMIDAMLLFGLIKHKKK